MECQRCGAGFPDLTLKASAGGALQEIHNTHLHTQNNNKTNTVMVARVSVTAGGRRVLRTAAERRLHTANTEGSMNVHEKNMLRVFPVFLPLLLSLS